MLQSDDYRSDVFGNDAKNVKLVTIFFGANDASDEKLNPRQHVPIPRYKENLKRIVSIVKNECNEDVKILIICPPPICHEERLKYQVQRYGDKATGELERTLELSKSYAEAASEVASELSLPCLNTWQIMCNQGDSTWKSYLCDGLHFSEPGNMFMGENLLKLIQENFSNLHVEPCPHTGNYGSSGSSSKLMKTAPWHDEIDHLKGVPI